MQSAIFWSVISIQTYVQRARAKCIEDLLGVFTNCCREWLHRCNWNLIPYVDYTVLEGE